MEKTLLLRITLAITLLFHSIPTIFDNSISGFGDYLNGMGLSPFGLTLAWLIKLSHIVGAVLLVSNKFLKWAVFPTILVLLMGIVMVHGKSGWFVVGGGQNGIEFNVLMIVTLLTVYLQATPDRR